MKDAALTAVPFVLFAMLVVFGLWLEAETRPPDREAEAIQRGHALHCPSDGRFAWKGECDE